MSLKVLIVEDEQLGLERLERQLDSLNEDVEIVGKTDSVSSTTAWLQCNTPPDLIFMDIDLGDGQSFEIFSQIEIRSDVIFTTSYDEHALQAFEESEIDHLLKPVIKSELRRVIHRQINGSMVRPSKASIDRLISALRKQLLTGFRQEFLARLDNRIISIDQYQVSYFFCESDHFYLRTRDKKKLLIEHNLDDLELSVDPNDFFRANKYFIISSGSVSKVVPSGNGSLILHLRPSADKPVLVEREKTSAFKNWIKR